LHFHDMFKRYRKVKLTIKSKKYTLAVADTYAKKKLGLSKLRKLPNKCGMLFVYNTAVNNYFTMEYTSIALTIIFLDKNFKILEVFKCRPYSKKKVRPESDYYYVIEIWITLYNIIFV